MDTTNIIFPEKNEQNQIIARSLIAFEDNKIGHSTA